MEVKDELFDVIHPLSDGKNRNCLALNRARRKIKKEENCKHTLVFGCKNPTAKPKLKFDIA